MTARSYNKSLWVMFIALVSLFAASCSDQRSQLPNEFTLDQPIYQTEKTHTFGPGGINQSFTVYELSQKVSATIADKGLPYLNSLPSALAQKQRSKPPKVYDYKIENGKKVPGMTGPWSGPFIDWHATPVLNQKEWLRFGHDLGKDWKPSVATFYVSFKGDPTANEFVSTISSEFAASFHMAISTPGNFYAYGGYRDMCVVVISPATGKLFVLYRD